MIVAGVLALIYREQAGQLFCKVGKASWKASTLGLTDMHWFYPEQKARRIGLQIGLMLCLFGVVFGSLAVMALSGPNSFAAMSQAYDFLKGTYGNSSSGYSFSCHSVPDTENDVIIHYKYSDKVGDLRASWDGKKYVFTEEREQGRLSDSSNIEK